MNHLDCPPRAATPAQADGLACVVCDLDFLSPEARGVHWVPVGRDTETGSQVFACESHGVAALAMTKPTPRCPCACNSGGFCGGCGHAGCGGRTR